MIEVAFSSSFKRAFKKRVAGNAELEEKFWKRVAIFTNNPYEPTLRTHKLSGELKGLWSFTVEYDVRVVFSFAGKNRAVFEDIGSHDAVY
jgi:mRNA-degrading endonuclease YafQ of YafQ-DinJ toxin-antitoxin module